MKRSRGYILVETLTAMAVLSITAATVQQAVYTAVQARGLSQDYTTAQWLMERIATTADLEPRLVSGDVHTGTFPPPDDRFRYSWAVDKVEVPLPRIPDGVSAQDRAALESAFVDYMGRLQIEISWSRGGQPFSVAGLTLFSPDRLWLDPMEATP